MISSSAWHEASHAVIAWCEGLYVSTVGIVDDAIGWCNHSVPADSPHNRNKLARVGLGGIVGETLASPTTADIWEGASGDVDFVLDLIGRDDLNHGRKFYRLYVQTEAKLKQHWPKVMLIARALTQYGSLTGNQVEAIMTA
jgi:hypothetical protein